MNERIKLLWEEATVSTWPRPGKFTAGEYDYHLKKFAQLIVRECADLAKHNVMNISTYADAEFVDRQIKQHFGVEL